MKLLSMIGTAVVGLSLGWTATSAPLPPVQPRGGVAVLQNEHIRLEYDLTRGTYRILDKRSGTVPISGAALRINTWSSRDEGLEQAWTQRPVSDELGVGTALEIRIQSSDRPDLLFSFVLHDNQGFLTLSGGIANTTGHPVQVRDICVLADGQMYNGEDFSTNFALVDGFSGGEPLEYGKRIYSPLHRSNALHSRNNLALTFGRGPGRRTLVMGGLTYADFEKFASVKQPRRVELEQGPDGQPSLLCYLDLPTDTQDPGPDGEVLTLVQGNQLRTWAYHEFRCREMATSVQAPQQVVLEARGLHRNKRYTLGFSWWRGFQHGHHGAHRQSLFLEFDEGGNTQRIPLVENHILAQFDSAGKQDVEQVEIPLPPEAIRAGNLRLVFEKPIEPSPGQADSAGKKKPVDPHVYVSEVWLRDGTSPALLPDTLSAINTGERPRRAYTAQLYARDPVGKRVDPQQSYTCPDRFYVDVTTTDPFAALEQYGKRVRRAQAVKLSMYDFPTVCLWYAENSHYGQSQAENTSLGAVQEMQHIADSGFLKYSRAAVRLVPDSYMPDNQQGWWDDAHWQRAVEPHNGSRNGCYVTPYETSEKWGRAVTGLGGIPLTYFQTGYRSEDYAKAFPEHMLFNKRYAWKGAPQDPLSELFTDWHQTWTRNGRVWGYDYTDPGFLAHMHQVYGQLKAGGVKGLMFDYPASGWARGGGMEDPYSTAAAAYRTIFSLAHDGLGPESYVHERNMERGSDLSIGLVASMRTENDTDRLDGATVTRCGMRWYKNRVLLNQDTDSKNIVRLAGDRDRVRAVLTMAYVTTGRLLLANSFSQFSTDTFRDVTRTFPYHTTPRSARPVDAFVSDFPTVYDYAVNPDWHQVTFFNPGTESSMVGIDLAGEPVDGALGLDDTGTYHVYDFWNKHYVGRLPGDARLQQRLRPGEARMMAVRKALDRPQLLSTDRHLMQGYVDVIRTAWDAERRILSGVSRVVGNDPYVLSLAANGFVPMHASCQDDDTRVAFRNGRDGLIYVTLTRPTNGHVKWTVTCLPPKGQGTRIPGIDREDAHDRQEGRPGDLSRVLPPAQWQPALPVSRRPIRTGP